MINDILILHVETSENICSVSISKNGVPILEINEKESHQHGKVLHVLIRNLLKQSNYEFNNLAAISISIGPGSYTGLRIGVSAVKGLAYALNIPVIAIDTLYLWAKYGLLNSTESTYKTIIPMMDARRMEVFSGYYSNDLQEIESPKPVILDENSFSEYAIDSTLFVGTGVAKASKILNHHNFHFCDLIEMSSALQSEPSYEKFKNQSFENIFTLEPFYLKAFYLGK